MTATIAAAASLVVTIVVHFSTDLDPNEYRFVQKMIVMPIIGYVMWVLYFNFCIKLLLGTDLDRSLRETKTAWSVLDIRVVVVLKNFCRSFGGGGAKTAPTDDYDDLRQIQLNKYMSMTAEELETEIRMLKSTADAVMMDIVCAENVKYTLDDSTLISSLGNPHK